VTTEERLAGGAGTLQNQLVDPFAAFAGGRLAIRTLDAQAQGLPALLRGNLVHDALYRLYFDLPSRSDILAWTDAPARVERAVDLAFARHEQHADKVLLRLLAMERKRVAGLLLEFLQIDGDRDAFVVDGIERKLELLEAGLRIELRIDRIDRLADGRIVIIDYKTGAEKKFLDRRGEPLDIQLVAYACAVGEPVAALALANIDSRVVGFHGAGTGFTEEGDWPARLEAWTGIVRGACVAIAQGDVSINGHQSTEAARPLNLLSRFTELRNAR
jgi:hypothetical protein